LAAYDRPVVLTDTERRADVIASAGSASGPDEPAARVPDAIRRRLARPALPDMTFWLVAALITLVGGTLRFFNLSHPPDRIFDELYYAEEAQDLLRYGVEWDPASNAPQYVVHPPLGKWLIAFGESIYGYNSLGWRFSAALAGTLSILMLILIAQRLFKSTILAGAAGLLMTLDGMHFVLSRTALLDIFLMFFVVLAFGFAILDREQRRARWLAAMEAGVDPSVPGRAGRPQLGIPWWRLACGLSLGLAAGVKWSAVWYILAIGLLILYWEVNARRSAGVRRAFRDTFLDETGWMLALGGIAVVAYLASWSGWFLTDDGYFRHYRADMGRGEPPIFGALSNLWHYHVQAWKFHTGLTTPHQYQSWPWQWLILGRPVAFHWSGDGPCGGASCAEEILLLGTPILWWSFLPALAGLLWLGIGRRDWRAGAIGMGVAAGILPWFWNQLDGRTMFYFYALPAEPFLVLAVVYVLGALIGPPRSVNPDSDQRLIGSVVAGAYMLLVAACFAYFYPVYAGVDLTHAEWYARMWLGSRWV
jgi:dolichyl-phosphate-mannose--protein O-mannosyl transferase